MNYILVTTDPQTRNFDMRANKEWSEKSRFENLEIMNQSEQGNKAIVEFKATYRIETAEEPLIHHEISKFRKQAGIWYYRDGKILS